VLEFGEVAQPGVGKNTGQPMVLDTRNLCPAAQ
jgi:hypothetical protein